jgi:HEAT repeat protein
MNAEGGTLMRTYTAVIGFAILLGLPLPSQAQDKVAETQEYIEKILKQANGRDAKERLEALDQMLMIAGTLQSEIVFLCTRLHPAIEHDPKVRQRAAKVLAALRPPASLVMDAVIGGLYDKDDGVRLAVMDIVGAIAPHSRRAIPRLLQCVNDKNPVIRRRAIMGLASFEAEVEFAIPALVLALDDPDDGMLPKVVNMRGCAILALKRIGPDAEAVGMTLSTLLHAEDQRIKAPGFIKQTKIDPKNEKLLPFFVQVLKNKDYPQLRASAAYALGLLGRVSAAAVPDLVVALKEKDQTKLAAFRKAVIWALGEIGPPAKTAVSVLRELETDATIRPDVLTSLKKIEGKQ